MPTRNSRLWTKLLPIIFIFLFTVVFFYPVLFQGKTFYAFDTLRQYLPWSSYTPNFWANNYLITDPVKLDFPFFHFLKSNIRQNIFPLWNGSNFCGIPIAAGGLSRCTNPIVFFSYLLFPLLTAHDLVLWFHLFGAGLFAFLYLRRINLENLPAFVGSMSWMFNGYVMVWFEFEFVIILAFSLPASLYFLELWLETRTRFHALCFAGATAFSIGSGFPQIIIYQFLFIGFYILYRYFQIKREKVGFQKIGKQDLINLSLAIILVFSISATFFVSHFSLLSESQRRGFTFEELYQQTGKLPVKYLTTLLYPDFFGTPTSTMSITPRSIPTQTYNNYNELCIYAGILPFLLALCCLPYLLKRTHVPFFLFAAIIPLTMAMGSILYYPLAEYIPGLNLSTPTRLLYVFGFSMSMLAAIGADILITVGQQKKWSIFTLWSLLVGIALILFFFIQTEAGVKWAASSLNLTDWSGFYKIFHQYFSSSPRVALIPITLVLLSFLLLTLTLFSKRKGLKTWFLFLGIVVLSYDLLSFGLHYNTASPRSSAYPPTDAIRFLQKDKSRFRVVYYGLFSHNLFGPFGISDIGGYAPFYPRRYGEFLHLSQNGLDVPLPDNFSRWVTFKAFGSPLLDLINMKYVLLPPSSSAQMPTLKLVYDNEITIYENKEAFPRVFFVPDYQFCGSRKEAYKALATYTTSDFRKKVILEALPPAHFRRNSKVLKHKTNSKINLIAYEPNRLEIDVSTNQKGFLVISDNYHPAWQAKVDGVETKVFRANYIMRAIPVKAGTHKVSLIFRPKLLMAGLVITAVGWAVFAVLVGSLLYKRRNSRPFPT